MLVLERRENQVIRIGDNIRIVIVKVKDNHGVRVGIEAPPDVPVHREEVYQAIQAAKEEPKQ